MIRSDTDRAELRLAFLTAPIEDVPMEADEAAVFMGWSVSKLRTSHAPRATIEHRVTFLRSQLIAYLKANHTYLLDEDGKIMERGRVAAPLPAPAKARRVPPRRGH
jgi:hypothetical protein